MSDTIIRVLETNTCRVSELDCENNKNEYITQANIFELQKLIA